MSTFTLGTVPITPLKTVSGADIKDVYQVAEEMGNSPAMVKNTISKRSQTLYGSFALKFSF
jgi:hypothetical protein